MSKENIKTGLKLSDAVRLIEENKNALIKYHNVNLSKWQQIYMITLDIDCKYGVKLPPLKTVTVIRDDVIRAIDKNIHLMKFEYLDEAVDAFCKELGL